MPNSFSIGELDHLTSKGAMQDLVLHKSEEDQQSHSDGFPMVRFALRGLKRSASYITSFDLKTRVGPKED